MTDARVTSAAVIDGVDVDAVAAAVTACSAVSGLFGGRGNAIASYLPGRRVPGVEVSASTVLITVRSRWDATTADLLAQISRAVSRLLQGKRLEVLVADIDDPSRPSLPAALDAPVVQSAAGVTVASAAHTPSARTPLPPTPSASSSTAVRLPGSAPAPGAPTPAPPPPNFPTV